MLSGCVLCELIGGRGQPPPNAEGLKGTRTEREIAMEAALQLSRPRVTATSLDLGWHTYESTQTPLYKMEHLLNMGGTEQKM